MSTWWCRMQYYVFLKVGQQLNGFWTKLIALSNGEWNRQHVRQRQPLRATEYASHEYFCKYWGWNARSFWYSTLVGNSNDSWGLRELKLLMITSFSALDRLDLKRILESETLWSSGIFSTTSSLLAFVLLTCAVWYKPLSFPHESCWLMRGTFHIPWGGTAGCVQITAIKQYRKNRCSCQCYYFTDYYIPFFTEVTFYMGTSSFPHDLAC